MGTLGNNDDMMLFSQLMEKGVFAKMKDLTLYLSPFITSDGISPFTAALAQGSFPHLLHLHLYLNGHYPNTEVNYNGALGPTGAIYLAQSIGSQPQHFKQLETLDLANNPIG